MFKVEYCFIVDERRAKTPEDFTHILQCALTDAGLLIEPVESDEDEYEQEYVVLTGETSKKKVVIPLSK